MRGDKMEDPGGSSVSTTQASQEIPPRAHFLEKKKWCSGCAREPLSWEK